MESTLLSGPSRDWLIVGSNGAIGSELTKALLRSRCFDASLPPVVRVHSHDTYAETNFDLLNSRTSSRPLRLLFCAGKGGFSLPQQSAELQHDVFNAFCRRLVPSFHLEKFIYISSLGAHCSELRAPYSQLIAANEQTVCSIFKGSSLILRLPSMYGYNERSHRHHGLIGVILQNLRLRRPTGIYARLETRRNYLSIHRLAPLLVRRQGEGGFLDQNGFLNIQSSISLSIFDVCTHFFRAVKQRPVLKLMPHSLVDEEHHYANAIKGARFIVFDPIGEWVSMQWNRCSPLLAS